MFFLQKNTLEIQNVYLRGFFCQTNWSASDREEVSGSAAWQRPELPVGTSCLSHLFVSQGTKQHHRHRNGRRDRHDR